MKWQKLLEQVKLGFSVIIYKFIKNVRKTTYLDPLSNQHDPFIINQLIWQKCISICYRFNASRKALGFVPWEMGTECGSRIWGTTVLRCSICSYFCMFLYSLLVILYLISISFYTLQICHIIFVGISCVCHMHEALQNACWCDNERII